MKKCTKCGKKKDLSMFHKSQDQRDGLKPRCKVCRNIESKKYYDENEEVYERKRVFVVVNKELVAASKKAWWKLNKKRTLLQQKAYKKISYKNNIQLRLMATLRRRLYSALKGKAKQGSAVRDLGCTPEQFKRYLESKFQNGMTWDNYGKWHIDHIMPLSSFDLTNYEQVKQACHYKNLQPLWAEDNLKKGVKLPSQRR